MLSMCKDPDLISSTKTENSLKLYVCKDTVYNKVIIVYEVKFRLHRQFQFKGITKLVVQGLLSGKESSWVKYVML